MGRREHTDDPERIDRVIALAVERLPLERMATGPADEDRFGPASEHHEDLGLVLGELWRFPGKGWPLIRAGLLSPVIDNRGTAVGALSAWTKESWPPEAEALLCTAHEREPDARTRELIHKVLAGERAED